MFDEKRQLILDKAQLAHETFYRSEVFGGPSLHFHLKALEASRKNNREDFCEFSYAMLAAWGMHRMGRGGSKMCEFNRFRESIFLVWQDAISLRDIQISNLTESGMQKIAKIFRSIKCMASATSLVGNSKVVAHLLPNLVPPMDRQYTLTFLYNHNRIRNDLVGEEKLFLQMLKQFFYPLCTEPTLVHFFAERQGREEYPWDTSILKMIDNLVVGVMRGPAFAPPASRPSPRR